MSRLYYYDPESGFVPYPDAAEEKQPQTNSDRLRQMSDEELATMLYEQGCFAPNCDRYEECYASCRECWLSWLKSPVEEVDNGT